MGTKNDFITFEVRKFQSKDVEYIIGKHVDIYASEYGFDATFRDYVVEAVYKFVECYDETKENIWIAEANEIAVGVIAIVKVDNSTAQLRWFLIEPQMRGKGLGNILMKTAIDFCVEKEYKQVFLWTISILEAARHLYKRYGFTLTEVNEHDIWGEHLIEERWDLYL